MRFVVLGVLAVVVLLLAYLVLWRLEVARVVAYRVGVKARRRQDAARNAQAISDKEQSLTGMIRDETDE